MSESFPFVKVFLQQFIDLLPKLILSIVILVLGLIIAKIVAKVIKKIFTKIGIDRIGEKLNEIEIVEKANIKIVPSTILSKTIYYFLLLLFIMISTEILEVEAISTLLTDLINFIPKLIVAVIILFLGLLFADFIRKLVLTTCKSLGLPSANLIANAVFYFLLINVLITSLKQTSISTSFLEGNFMILIAGGVLAFALGYGLASKDLVSNFLSSFYLKDRFKVGDRIRLDGVEGKIVDVGKSFITLENEGNTIMIPTNKILKEKIEIIK